MGTAFTFHVSPFIHLFHYSLLNINSVLDTELGLGVKQQLMQTQPLPLPSTQPLR